MEIPEELWKELAKVKDRVRELKKRFGTLAKWGKPFMTELESAIVYYVNKRLGFSLDKLSRLLFVDKTTLYRAVKKIEEKGMVSVIDEETFEVKVVELNPQRAISLVEELLKSKAKVRIEDREVSSVLSGPEERYGLLPSIPEHVVEKTLKEVSDFATLMRHDPKEAERSIQADVKWLSEHKDFLGKAVEAAIDSALELYSDKLTHKDYVELRTYLLKGVLLVLQMINKSMKDLRE